VRPVSASGRTGQGRPAKLAAGRKILPGNPETFAHKATQKFPKSLIFCINFSGTPIADK